MSSKIRILNEQTINLIAAGEVIENPASVVKELIENSLDAKANEIAIEVKAGGRQLIRIVDNGCGMNKDDAMLCLERHATSKIRQAEDLYKISSMGFRGEAIPSIASVSKFTLLTCPEGENAEATLLCVEGGRILKSSRSVRTKGTTIEVKSLFFNVPVRKKFLKSISFDTGEINKTVGTIALGNPQIKFQLIHNGKPTLSLDPWPELPFIEGQGERIKTILGKGFFSSLCPVDFQKGEYRIKGMIGDPCYTKHNRTGQYFFVNGRPVFSPYLSSAVLEGYATRLNNKRYPVFVLNIFMPGEFVDVNVHPQKREVRLQEQPMLRDLIKEAIHQSFSKEIQEKRPPLYETERTSLPWEQIPNDQPHIQENNSSPDPSYNILRDTQNAAKNLSQKRQANDPTNEANHIGKKVDKESRINPPRDCEKRPTGLFPKTKTLDISPPSSPFERCLPSNLFSSDTAREIELPLDTEPSKNAYKVLSTIDNYIFLQKTNPCKNECLAILDQRAAHSRILFEAFLKEDKSFNENQSLIVPLNLEFPSLESSILEENLDLLQSIGIHIRSFGKNAFIVHSLPLEVEHENIKEFLSDLIQNLRSMKNKNVFLEEKKKSLALIACRSPIKKHSRLRIEEAQDLFKKLMQCRFPDRCPLGKATMIRLRSQDIERKFQTRGILQ